MWFDMAPLSFISLTSAVVAVAQPGASTSSASKSSVHVKERVSGSAAGTGSARCTSQRTGSGPMKRAQTQGGFKSCKM